MRVDCGDAIPGRCQLRPAHVRSPMDDLPLKVAEVDDVEIDDADSADPGRGEVHRSGRAEPARADAEDAAGFQATLPVHSDFRHDEMPAVSLHLILRQLGKGALGLT